MMDLSQYKVVQPFSRALVSQIRADFVAVMEGAKGRGGVGNLEDQGGVHLMEIPSDAIREAIKILEGMVGMTCNPRWCSCRIQHPDGRFQIRWHQDASPLRMRGDLKGVIGWMFLDPLDGTRPSLEIAPPTDYIEHTRDIRHFLIAPEFEGTRGTVLQDLPAGSLAFFSPYAPHRTYITPGMTNTRLSIDFRFRSDWSPTFLPSQGEDGA